MANQSLARLATNGDNLAESNLNPVECRMTSSLIHFTYLPLDTSVDSLRLVILEPSNIREADVYCRLVHVTFGEMPKYEALSYIWGSEALPNAIVLNRKTFPVRDNLWEALLSLRKPTEERVLWIDAICINQDDIPERNQQVCIMPHIYSRAQTVLVWLGSYDSCNRTTWQDVSQGWDSGSMLSRMCYADYWNRVWIVQEIGKARRIVIHYTQIKVEWQTFINTISRRRLFRDCMPLKLEGQMLGKYGSGHKLENLLKTHQKALCKDVRDKIYGFTGLANDTYGRLAMDYGKTPVEVWKDVVRFRNADQTIPQYDILQFAGFARDLLGGLLGNTEDTVTGRKLVMDDERTFAVRDQEKQKELVLCPARLWGRIACVGPTYKEIRANLRKVDEWTANIRDHVPDLDLWNAYYENDLLLQILEDMDHSDFEMVFPLIPKTWFDLDSAPGDAVNILSNIEPKSSTWRADDSCTSSIHGDTLRDKHLILLDICPRGQSKIMGTPKPFIGIGLAPNNVAVGDFICYFYLKDRAAVIRREMGRCSIIASAVFPDVRAMGEEKTKTNKKVKMKFAILNKSPLKSSETIKLKLDLEGVFEWSF